MPGGSIMLDGRVWKSRCLTNFVCIKICLFFQRLVVTSKKEHLWVTKLLTWHKGILLNPVTFAEKYRKVSLGLSSHVIQCS